MAEYMGDVRRILSDLAVSEAAMADLVEGLSDWQLNWQQHPGRSWSVAQCIDHLALSNELYAKAMIAAVRHARKPEFEWHGPIEMTVFGRWFVEQVEPPSKSKFGAPKSLQPAPRSTVSEVVDAFRNSHAAVRQVIAESQGMNLNAVRFRNPIVPIFRVRLGTGFQIIAAHERRHLWQAANVRLAALTN